MKYLNTLVFVIAASLCSMAQSSAGNLRNGDKAISTAGTVKLATACTNGGDARFRLSNMTEWAISVRTFSLYVHPTRYKRYQLRDGRRIFLLPANEKISSLIYKVEKAHTIGGKLYIEYLSNGMDSFNQSWLAPGDSVFFDVPLTSSDDESRLYVYFNYEWEIDEKGFVRTGSVQHRVVHPGSNENTKVPLCN